MGILLIPAAEMRLEGADVVLLNVRPHEIARLRTFDDLRNCAPNAAIRFSLLRRIHSMFWAASIGDRLLEGDRLLRCDRMVPFLQGLV